MCFLFFLSLYYRLLRAMWKMTRVLAITLIPEKYISLISFKELKQTHTLLHPMPYCMPYWTWWEHIAPDKSPRSFDGGIFSVLMELLITHTLKWCRAVGKCQCRRGPLIRKSMALSIGRPGPDNTWQSKRWSLRLAEQKAFRRLKVHPVSPPKLCPVLLLPPPPPGLTSSFTKSF